MFLGNSPLSELNPTITSILKFDLASLKHLLFHFFMLPQNLVHTSLHWHSARGFILGSFTTWSSIWDCRLFEDQDTSFQPSTWLSRAHHCSWASVPATLPGCAHLELRPSVFFCPVLLRIAHHVWCCVQVMQQVTNDGRQRGQALLSGRSQPRTH